jgi:putative Mg2+ transporter-C (MgtC) family protein
VIGVLAAAEGSRFGEASASWGDQLELVGLIAVAGALGALIGVERELADKSAGLRTHALVAAGSALAAGVGEVLLTTAAGADAVSGDPVRALHAVLTGIGFLGAGAIIRHRGEGSVEGLTTAASLWLAAAVGIATGLGMWVLAAGATVLALVVLAVVRRLDRWLARRGHPGRSG